jgi:GT2 family glycosyltransferase
LLRSQTTLEFAAIAIGRNEGARLKRCLDSLSRATRVIYVDSGSTDGSAQWSSNHCFDVIKLDTNVPFTAARARNAGFRHLKSLAPNLEYVQFIDGDCELDPQWPELALDCLAADPGLAAVCGRRRERFPEKSIYNWLCDLEWDTPVGEVRAFAGDVMIRVSALGSVGSYREDMIAGEEPELCVRLRAAGWRIWRLPAEMTLHDAAMTRFGQWWRRAYRAGYAFAQGAYLHGAPPERHWVWESRRAWFWGVWLPIAFICVSAALWPWGLLMCLVYPLQVLRQTVRNAGPLPDRAILAFFQTLARFPEGLGQFKFFRDRWFGRRAGLVEYK